MRYVLTGQEMAAADAASADQWTQIMDFVTTIDV